VLPNSCVAAVSHRAAGCGPLKCHDCEGGGSDPGRRCRIPPSHIPGTAETATVAADDASRGRCSWIGCEGGQGALSDPGAADTN